jgi:nucleotide-binding universal stress UspA family protein
MLDRVLIPVDFSEQCMMMIDCARELMELGSRYLTIMHVAPKGKTLSHDENNKLNDMLTKLREADIKATLLIRYGDAVDAIVEEANKEHVDMIAMASGGKSKAEAFFVGSVSFGIIRKSSKPILLDKFPDLGAAKAQACRIGPHLFRHALVSVDMPMSCTNLEELFDTLCMRGLREATLFHVIDSAKYKVGDNKRFAEVKLGLDDMQRKTRGGTCKVMTHLHYGTPVYNILEGIKEVDASVVIIGTKKMSSLRGATLGSTAEEVVRKCPIPVLVVPC